MSLLYKALAVGLALLALVGGVRYTLHLRDKVQVLEVRAEQAEKALKRTQATWAKREKDRAATARLVASTVASTEAALAAAPEWADAPVPKEVQDALCATLRCAGPDGVQHDSAPAQRP